MTACLGVFAWLAASSCGAPADDGAVDGRRIVPIASSTIPSSVLDLRVTEEDVRGTVHRFDRSYADRVSLYGFRAEDDLLVATLQVSRFADPSKLRDAGFRAGLVSQIGAVRPERVRVDRTAVDVTRANGQKLDVWMRGRYVFVLAVRDDYARPRDLLRQAVEITP
jgi:hypothetical protein